MDIICCKGTPGAESICDPVFWRYNPGNSCDLVIKNYCANSANKFDPICSCINSKSNLPHCQDPACQKNGYVLKSLSSIPCPTIINCEQNTSNIEANTGGTANINQVQICGSDERIQKILKEEGEEGILKVLDDVIYKPPEQNFWTTSRILIFIIFIILIIITGFVRRSYYNNLEKN